MRTMPLEPGQTLAHYRIVEKVGEGAMGVVWKAFDHRLERDVALKVLNEDLGRDSARLMRFEREAKAVAALNHPSIVTIHSVEEAEGIRFITMELVEGETLAQLIPGRDFSLEEFFEITIPMCDAVIAAHETGIVHRDLKVLP